MLPFLLSDEEFSYYKDKIDNINFHFLESFKEENQLNNEKYQNKEYEINNIFSKDNNAFNSIIAIKENKKFIYDSTNFNSGKEDENTEIFLNKKRKNDKADDDNYENIFEKEESKENNKKREKMKINNKIKKDRRRKNAEYDKKAVHDKFKEDNIIKKIKTNIFDYILERLNKSLKDNLYEFYPLTKTLNSNLKKDFNEKLLERTIYDIYINSYLRKRFVNISNSNKILIKKIYDENIEVETQSILEKTFKEILDDIREKDLDYFLEKIKDKETKNNKALNDSYINDVKKMLFKYELWFKAKIGRSETKRSSN